MILIMRAFTAITLSQAAGFNAILPLLLIAIIGRYEGFFISHGYPAPVSLPDNLIFITSGWSILFFVVMTILESVIDKAQWFDNVKHVTIDPVVSSLSSAGITWVVMANPLSEFFGKSNDDILSALPQSLCLISGNGPGFWIGIIFFIILGLFITLSFLFIKTAFRWVISALPDMGVSNFLVSLLEDGVVVISVFLALFSPVLAIIFTLLLGGSALWVVFYLRRQA
ncbi:MAG: DUF4126 domain-containing protein, partial [Candidatus Eremiobacterota bacterium]